MINANSMYVGMFPYTKSYFLFSVKPTIAFAGEARPVMTDADTDEDVENIEPTGDLADLTASVREGMPTDEDFPGGSQNSNYKGKGKGVGKGKSGSSGAPTRKTRKGKKAIISQNVPSDNQADSVEENAPKPSR